MARSCAFCIAVLLGLGVWLDAADVYRAGDGVPAPKILHKVNPSYSAEAEELRVQGTVVLEVLVDETGAVAESSVISPMGFGLDESAQQAVSQWKFRPEKRNGKPARVLTTVQMSFRLPRQYFDGTTEKHRTAYNVAVHEMSSNRRTRATLETVKDLALQKYPPAMYLYAKLIGTGDGYPQDRELSLRLMQAAAAQNEPAAVYEIGRMTMKGDRVPQDAAAGLGLVKRAAVLGSKQAQFYLGAAYQRGDGLPQDNARARQFFRLCAAQAEVACQIRLAELLLDVPGRDEQQYLQALAWLGLAAARGDVQAKMILAPEQARLTPNQVSWVSRLKDQLERTP